MKSDRQLKESPNRGGGILYPAGGRDRTGYSGCSSIGDMLSGGAGAYAASSVCDGGPPDLKNARRGRSSCQTPDESPNLVSREELRVGESQSEGTGQEQGVRHESPAQSGAKGEGVGGKRGGGRKKEGGRGEGGGEGGRDREKGVQREWAW